MNVNVAWSLRTSVVNAAPHNQSPENGKASCPKSYGSFVTENFLPEALHTNKQALGELTR
jgi:hypothetical protein